jgi:CubicO group peptidase (beta-lactamase class C family)
MDVTQPEIVGFSSKRLARIDALMQRYVDEGKLTGMVTRVARQGRLVHAAEFGMADPEADRSMQPDTIFRIASMTKPVTSVAAMMLYEEGCFHLNTPISDFIPGFEDVRVFVRKTDEGVETEELARPITFRHLFTHTAGLSYGWNADDPIDALYQEAQQAFKQSHPDAEPTIEEVVALLTEVPLAFQPGTRWRYSLSIDVLGHIVERISGMSLAAFLAERIFEPLGMVDTGFYVPEEKLDRVAVVYGHPEGAEELTRLDDIEVPVQQPRYLSGGGGLMSTAGDYARFAQMLAGGGVLDGVRLLSPRTVALYSLNHAPVAALPYGFADGEDLYHWGYGYSLGTRVLMDVSKSGLPGSVGEFGWDGAFSTYFWVDPVEALYGLLMVQHHPNAYYPIAQQFKQVVYQALVA